MKKFLLVVLLISILFLVGCNSNKNQEINNLSGVNENQEIINDEVTFDKDFDERIKKELSQSQRQFFLL